jgi:hypothetical protein
MAAAFTYISATLTASVSVLEADILLEMSNELVR